MSCTEIAVVIQFAIDASHYLEDFADIIFTSVLLLSVMSNTNCRSVLLQWHSSREYNLYISSHALNRRSRESV